MNRNKLKAKCIEKGLNFAKLSNNVDISRGAFYRRLKNNCFTIEEVKRISEALELTHDDIMAIFFVESVS